MRLIIGSSDSFHPLQMKRKAKWWVEPSIDELAEVWAQKTGFTLSRVKAVLVPLSKSPVNQPLSAATIFNIAKDHLGYRETITLLEKENLDHFKQCMNLYHGLKSRFSPFYTLPELQELAVAFSEHLKQNEAPILHTGYPTTTFEKSRWHDLMLSRLYPTKVPLFDFEMAHIKDGEILNMDWDQHPDSTMILRQEDGNFGFIYSWAKEPMRFVREGGHALLNPVRMGYTWKNGHASTEDGRITKSRYDEACDHLQGFGGEVESLDEDREVLYALRMKILERLQSALDCQDSQNLWPDCLAILRDRLPLEVFDVLIELDNAVEEMLHTPVHPECMDNVYALSMHNGGLQQLLELTVHHEFELRDRSCHNKKMEILELVGSKELPNHYFEFLGHPRRSDFDKMIDDFHESRCLPPCVLYNRLRNYEIQKELRRRVSFHIDLLPNIADDFEALKPSYGEFMRSKIEEDNKKPLMQRLVDAADAGRPEMLKGGERSGSGKTEADQIRRFRTPDGITWEKIVINFISNDEIQIRAGAVSETYHFSEIGFKDRRKRGAGIHPTQLWRRFRAFAAAQGEVPYARGPKEREQQRALMKELRKRLKAIIGLAEDPIPFVHGSFAYKFRFTLRDGRLGAGLEEEEDL